MALRNDYEVRKRDVKTYVALIKKIDAQKYSQQSRRILRANVFILLYNLIESTITNCGKELDDACANITTDQISDLTEIVRNYWIKFISSGSITDSGGIHFSDKFHLEKIKSLTEKILTPNSLLGLKFDFDGRGNLDGVKITELFGKYGIETTLPRKLERQVCYHRFNSGKGILQFIKDTRNALAHGEKSFTEFGDYSTNDIKKYAIIVFRYLEFMIGIIEDFIQNKKYLKEAISSKIIT